MFAAPLRGALNSLALHQHYCSVDVALGEPQSKSPVPVRLLLGTSKVWRHSGLS